MKTILFIVVLMLGMIASSQAQNHIENNVVLTGIHFANSGTDSLKGSQSTLPSLTWNGLFPDSISVDFVGYDTCRGKIYFRAQYVGTNLWSRDSVAAIGSNNLFGTALVSRSLYLGKDQFNVAYVANSSGNGVTTNDKVWLRVRRYFTFSP